MTANNDSFDYDDPTLISLLAGLDLADNETSPPPPPRTPSPRPASHPTVQRHTFPAMNGRSHAATRLAIYQYESPTRRGYTTKWSVAGTATQGVPGGYVHVVGAPPPTQNKPKFAAYVVFSGRRVGVFSTWREAESLVKGVSKCIFRGYKTTAEARAAFAYASERSWVRVIGAPIAAAIPVLPQPVVVADGTNPLNGTEDFDGKWYVVYRGITPGVYRSHLECQLNTVGVRGALHQSVQVTFVWNAVERMIFVTLALRKLVGITRETSGIHAAWVILVPSNAEWSRHVPCRRPQMEP
ncbi:hypothetical protein B0H13DRAFT_2338759 [Mycena leptocephala]|nr:hypothetical protein B0H13DRAFT_2338759 [Mycena leptocephala]